MELLAKAAEETNEPPVASLIDSARTMAAAALLLEEKIATARLLIEGRPAKRNNGRHKLLDGLILGALLIAFGASGQVLQLTATNVADMCVVDFIPTPPTIEGSGGGDIVTNLYTGPAYVLSADG